MHSLHNYFSRIQKPDIASGSRATCSSHAQSQCPPTSTPTPTPTPTSIPEGELNLVGDPGLRPPITSYVDPIMRENVRRAYLTKGPTQPILSDFPCTSPTSQNQRKRKFRTEWYYGGSVKKWLEYSESTDAVFCLYCYLFGNEFNDIPTDGVFVTKGFRNWKKMTEKLKTHEGKHNSRHTKCIQAGDDLLRQEQHIEFSFANMTEQAKIDYRIRLKTSLRSVRWLLKMGQPFRGHDESEDSLNKGMFMELLSFWVEDREQISKVVMGMAPENHKLTSPMIQKDLIRSCASLTTKAIIKDIGDSFFTLLVDEARDSSIKEQMAIALRYVDKKGCVIERIVGVVHVADTSDMSLKAAIDDFCALHGLSMSRCRGQGYDGASNMNGKFNGLKSLILREHKSAFYVHCFAHQLQLTLNAIAKKHGMLQVFFGTFHRLTNVVGSSCKRKDMLRVKQHDIIIEEINCGVLETGRGLNQETTLKRPRETRWGSHYGTVVSLIGLYPCIIDMLDAVFDDPEFGSCQNDARICRSDISEFEFLFMLHLMKYVLGMTFELSLALQKKDQDLVNAMVLVNLAKTRLQKLRDDGFENVLNETSAFAIKNEVDVPQMKDLFVYPITKRRRGQPITNLHHYKVALFYTVIDSQLQELNDRFDNVNTELLRCIACLNPRDSFVDFDKSKLVEFAKFYPSEFDEIRDLIPLENQLETFFEDMKSNPDFSDLYGIGELAQKMVEKRKNINYPLVYLLVTLALTLPVATATVERAFSTMNIIKNDLRNRIGDEFLNDAMVCYIEKKIFTAIDDEDIMKEFQKMKNRRGML